MRVLVLVPVQWGSLVEVRTGVGEVQRDLPVRPGCARPDVGYYMESN